VVELVAEAYPFAEIDDGTITALLEDPSGKPPGIRPGWVSSPSRMIPALCPRPRT
jgi:hypothetical protein